LLEIKYQFQARWILIEVGLIVLTILVIVNFILGCGLFVEAVDNRRRNDQEEEEEALRLQHQQRPRRRAAGIARSESFWIPNPQDIPEGFRHECDARVIGVQPGPQHHRLLGGLSDGGRGAGGYLEPGGRGLEDPNSGDPGGHVAVGRYRLCWGLGL
jgi:hypothetical protein